MLDIEFAQLTDPGKVRDHNEDFMGYVPPVTPSQVRSHGWLFALADGVGGQDRGEVASRTVIESMLSGFRASGKEPHQTLLPKLVQAANLKVFEAGHAEGQAAGAMATTVVACAVRFDRAVVVNVGDSRCYVIRRGEAVQLSRDHTLVSEHVKLGLISAEDAAESDSRHVLSRAIGSEMVVNVETSEHQVQPGDVLLLCSDGLHGALPESELIRVISRNAPLKDVAKELVTLANERDGGDNVSLQLARIRGVERVGVYRGRQYPLR